MGFLVKLDIDGIDRQLERLEREKETYLAVRKLLATSIEELEVKEGKDLKDEIILMYLKLQSVVDVAAKLNEAGMRIQTDTHAGQRKYSSNDITQIVYYDTENNSKHFKIARLYNKYNSRLLSEKELIKHLLAIRS
ncbi:MAG TPA: hypothetical protein VD757_00685 [Candidatus Nitrosocosmicus sp.]|nr:hypothetical protein [Candidatus Nitrosocosmicus sp.]